MAIWSRKKSLIAGFFGSLAIGGVLLQGCRNENSCEPKNAENQIVAPINESAIRKSQQVKEDYSNAKIQKDADNAKANYETGKAVGSFLRGVYDRFTKDETMKLEDYLKSQGKDLIDPNYKADKGLGKVAETVDDKYKVFKRDMYEREADGNIYKNVKVMQNGKCIGSYREFIGKGPELNPDAQILQEAPVRYSTLPMLTSQDGSMYLYRTPEGNESLEDVIREGPIEIYTPLPEGYIHQVFTPDSKK